jgi:hypothetical protein
MDQSRYQLTEDICLDARRAIWFANAGILAVADLHLGYVWAHRLNGQLFPISVSDDTVSRLVELQKIYGPREIVVVGDVVHRAVALPAMQTELTNLAQRLASKCLLTLVSGNHDRDLDHLLARSGLAMRMVQRTCAGNHLLIHGDNDSVAGIDQQIESTCARGGRVVMGHEHPAVSISDGVATWEKCPCFLISDGLIILPAFSHWAAGTVIGSYPFMSPLAQKASFTQAVAIVGNRLLPMRLG